MPESNLSSSGGRIPPWLAAVRLLTAEVTTTAEAYRRQGQPIPGDIARAQVELSVLERNGYQSWVEDRGASSRERPQTLVPAESSQWSEASRERVSQHLREILDARPALRNTSDQHRFRSAQSLLADPRDGRPVLGGSGPAASPPLSEASSGARRSSVVPPPRRRGSQTDQPRPQRRLSQTGPRPVTMDRSASASGTSATPMAPGVSGSGFGAVPMARRASTSSQASYRAPGVSGSGFGAVPMARRASTSSQASYWAPSVSGSGFGAVPMARRASTSSEASYRAPSVSGSGFVASPVAQHRSLPGYGATPMTQDPWGPGYGAPAPERHAWGQPAGPTPYQPAGVPYGYSSSTPAPGYPPPPLVQYVVYNTSQPSLAAAANTRGSYPQQPSMPPSGRGASPQGWGQQHGQQQGQGPGPAR